jgi:tripartite-type tricarboxylate transporter receptor subunit TctC
VERQECFASLSARLWRSPASRRRRRIIVGTTAGGGYDAYARLVARHLGKHIPGNPTFVVSNMPGAGSHTAGAYIAKVAPKDGTAIGAIFGGALVEPLIGTTVPQYDPSSFRFLGSTNDDVYICLARKDAPPQSMKEALEKEIIMGASNASSSSDFSAILKNVIGARFRIVLGYTGSRNIMLATEKNEVQGACGFAWPSINVTNANWFGEQGFVRVLAQTHVKGHPELNAMGVPLASSFARTPEEKAILELYFSHTGFGRPYLVASEVPRERVDALRAAFTATMKDADYVAEGRRMGLDIDAVDGEEVQRLVGAFYAAPADLVGKVKAALKPPG